MAWTIGMYARLLALDRAELDELEPEQLQEALEVLDEVFPDADAACEVLGASRRWPWTEGEVEELLELYPYVSTAELARRFGRSRQSVYNKANLAGVKKSPAYQRKLGLELGARLKTAGRSTRFLPGQIPRNKGAKGWQAGGRSAETQFKKGHRPHTWKPIGTEVDVDGYLKRKVSETGKRVDRWPFVHVLIWEEHFGCKVPPGCVVAFKDGDKTNLSIENLGLLTRAELAEKNRIHNNYPPELVSTILVLGHLKRAIREREEYDG